MREPRKIFLLEEKERKKRRLVKIV